MKTFMMIAAMMVVAAVAVSAADPELDGKVLVLDESNFDDVINGDHGLTLVEFYAPWCGHCKKLAGPYGEAAETLDGEDAGRLAKVDCTADGAKELCTKYGVRGFPTLKLFRNDGSEPTDYDKAREAKAIVGFMKKQNEPAVSELSADDVAGWAQDQALRVVAYVADEDVTAFTATANKLRNDYSFAVVKGASAGGDIKVPSVVLIRDFDENNEVFEGAFDGETFADDLESFIKTYSFPLVGTIGPENYAKYLERGLSFCWLFVDESNDEQTALINDVVTKAAAEYRSDLSFVKLDGIKWGEHAKSFGLSGSTPGIVIEDRDRNKKYIFPEDNTNPSLEEFTAYLAGWKDGSLVAHVKTEPVPENNDGPVTVLVGSTFDDIVFDDAKDVFVEFYAPWCGHCKSLAPKWDELGEKFAGNDNVVIAKVDATANDTPADVRGFPTLIMYPAGDKKNPVEYSGAREVADMATFVTEKGTTGAAASDGVDSNADGSVEGHEEL